MEWWLILVACFICLLAVANTYVQAKRRDITLTCLGITGLAFSICLFAAAGLNHSDNPLIDSNLVPLCYAQAALLAVATTAVFSISAAMACNLYITVRRDTSAAALRRGMRWWWTALCVGWPTIWVVIHVIVAISVGDQVAVVVPDGWCTMSWGGRATALVVVDMVARYFWVIPAFLLTVSSAVPIARHHLQAARSPDPVTATEVPAAFIVPTPFPTSLPRDTIHRMTAWCLSFNTIALPLVAWEIASYGKGNVEAVVSQPLLWLRAVEPWLVVFGGIAVHVSAFLVFATGEFAWRQYRALVRRSRFGHPPPIVVPPPGSTPEMATDPGLSPPVPAYHSAFRSGSAMLNPFRNFSMTGRAATEAETPGRGSTGSSFRSFSTANSVTVAQQSAEPPPRHQLSIIAEGGSSVGTSPPAESLMSSSPVSPTSGMSSDDELVRIGETAFARESRPMRIDLPESTGPFDAIALSASPGSRRTTPIHDLYTRGYPFTTYSGGAAEGAAGLRRSVSSAGEVGAVGLRRASSGRASSTHAAVTPPLVPGRASMDSTRTGGSAGGRRASVGSVVPASLMSKFYG